MTQHGEGEAIFERFSALELAVANLEEKVKTLEMTVNDIRWGREHP